jgi:putative ATP-dependent endonuclease of OLD family
MQYPRYIITSNNILNMYISRLFIRNFRNFQELDVPLFNGVTCIVGENNVGKTNLLHAIRLVIDASLSSQHRTLQREDFPASLDLTTPQQVVISIELRNYATRPHEEATAGPWAVDDDLARLTYRFRPGRKAREEFEAGERDEDSITFEDYRWEIRGAGGDTEPSDIEWNEDYGSSVRFEELQQFLVTLMHPLRDVEQSLRQTAGSPLGKIVAAAEIPVEEKANLVRLLETANSGISQSTTIADIGQGIEETFADTAGEAYAMDILLGMSSPTFSDIAKNLTIMLSNGALTNFPVHMNGLGMNNILYITMLLRVFESRAASTNYPGQLLLIEEPEAHLHPQLQRVLFGALIEKGFQIIASTHSTHITSKAPLESIIVLTNNDENGTVACAPVIDGGLDVGQSGDLDRYLDATKGALLYARKVILVEGPAELFLISGLIQSSLNIDLDSLGISVIPIYGVHFDVYARLFGPDAITRKCAIIADADMQPEDLEDDDEEEGVFIAPEFERIENDFVQFFQGATTFERAITNVSTLPMFATAAQELEKPRSARRMRQIHKSLVEEDDRDLLEEARSLVLRTAKRCGKARFAQVASKYIPTSITIPRYITGAIEWLNDTQ